MKFIAFTGHARTGKDSAARILVEEFGFSRYAFADPMREALLRLDPYVEANALGYVRLSQLVRYYGWEKAKSHDDVRCLLQRFGTEAGRELHGENCWVSILFLQLMKDAPERVVITDCRFSNEAVAVREMGGIVVRICRPGTGPVNFHPSDLGLPPHLIDHIIQNDGDLTQLANTVRRLAQDYLFPPSQEVQAKVENAIPQTQKGS